MSEAIKAKCINIVRTDKPCLAIRDVIRDFMCNRCFTKSICNKLYIDNLQNLFHIKSKMLAGSISYLDNTIYGITLRPNLDLRIENIQGVPGNAMIYFTDATVNFQIIYIKLNYKFTFHFCYSIDTVDSA